MDAAIINHSADLEVLRQLGAVIASVETLREDLVSHLDGFEVHLQLISQLDLRHVPPLLTCIGVSLLLTRLLVQLARVERLDLLGISCDCAACKE